MEEESSSSFSVEGSPNPNQEVEDDCVDRASTSSPYQGTEEIEEYPERYPSPNQLNKDEEPSFQETEKKRLSPSISV